MCPLLRKTQGIREILAYTLPKLHTGKNWYVDFSAYDPVGERMKRKKIMLDSIPKLRERKARAAEIIEKITNQLRQGWNPWVDHLTGRQYHDFEEVMRHYGRYIDKLAAAKVLKEKTLYDYQSRLNILLDYNRSLRFPIVYIYQFDQIFISDFLDYILLDRDSSARTRNNYRTWLSALCSYLIEKQYLEKNPVERIKSLAEEDKTRLPLQREDLMILGDFLKSANPYFLLACQMEYYTFIRPDELSNIRLKDIHVAEQKVFISGAISKNRRDGMVGLNRSILKLMVELEIFRCDSDYYLFGRDFKPSAKKADSRIFREYFSKVRTTLGWTHRYQFYSLKDSGIRDLANAEGIVIARDQARHSDISTTNRYLQGDAMPVHEETKRFAGAL